MDSKTAKVLTSSEQIDREWLITILSRSAANEAGQLSDFYVTASTSANAQIFRIHLNYCGATNGTLPSTLILKICNGGGIFLSDSEVYYYNRDYLDLSNAPIPRCYDAQYSAMNGAYHILMEDLTDTHFKDSEPSLEYGVAVARSLALLHAHGWGEQRIKALDQRLPAQSEVDTFMSHLQQGLSPLLEATNMETSADDRKIITQIFQRYAEKMLKRTEDMRGFAVLHGDLNPGNILSPKEGDGKIYFLDRQPFHWSLTTWLAVSDLVIMMIPYWSVDRRRQFENTILEEYHKRLVQLGITDYSWEQLLYDYRLSIMQG